MCREHFGYYLIKSSKHVYKGGIISFNQCLASGGGSLLPQVNYSKVHIATASEMPTQRVFKDFSKE